MKRIIVLTLFICCIQPNYSQNKYVMGWCGFIKGDVNKAKILTRYPDTSSIKDYCVIFDSGLFDPMGIRGIDIQYSRPVFFNNIFLLLSFPSRETERKYSLQIIIDKSMPLCQECDGGCIQFKESHVDTVIVELNVEQGARIRRTFDIGSHFKSWNIIGFKVTATLLDDKNILVSSSTSAGGWPWCM